MALKHHEKHNHETNSTIRQKHVCKVTVINPNTDADLLLIGDAAPACTRTLQQATGYSCSSMSRTAACWFPTSFWTVFLKVTFAPEFVRASRETNRDEGERKGN